MVGNGVKAEFFWLIVLFVCFLHWGSSNLMWRFITYFSRNFDIAFSFFACELFPLPLFSRTDLFFFFLDSLLDRGLSKLVLFSVCVCGYFVTLYAM